MKKQPLCHTAKGLSYLREKEVCYRKNDWICVMSTMTIMIGITNRKQNLKYPAPLN